MGDTVRGAAKLGLWGLRADNGGLGKLSLDHFRHLNPDKIMVMTGVSGYEDHPARYNGAKWRQDIDHRTPSREDIAVFLDGLDVAIVFETSYCREFYDMARAAGVATVCQLNYEWLDLNEGAPDIWQVPAKWHVEDIPGNVCLLPSPVDRERIPYRERKIANVFLHVAGHADMRYDRNGTQLLLDALPLVKSDIKLVIKSQTGGFRLPADRRLFWTGADAPDSAAFFDEADIMIYPRLYGGQSLIINEAAAAGLPIITTDMKPQSEFIPAETLIWADGFSDITIKKTIERAHVTPFAVAATIDRLAGQDIVRFSQRSNEYADRISWKTLLPKYKAMIDRAINLQGGNENG